MTRGQADRWIRALLARDDVKATGKLLGVYIAHAIADDEQPTQAELARRSGLHEKTVAEHVGRLQRLGAVTTERTITHQGWARSWVLHDEENWA